ncbi:MAG: hypothetical protein N4A35_00495 [Flavobacteriales bacterium]|jgi:hypothetical protein|nr:hypothetical protein [Flavobacteriales bacterium]
MKALFTIILMTLTFGVTFAQKIKEKKGQIYVDGVELLFVEKIKLAGNIDFVVKDLKENDLINFVMKDYYDPDKLVTKTDPRTKVKTTTRGATVSYYEISFVGLEDFCESGYVFPTNKGVAKFVIKNKLADSKTGVVDLENAKAFIERIGKEETRRREEISGNKVIIINENSAPSNQEGDGVTIKKGNVKVNIGN